MTYDAFVSYSQKADRPIAQALRSVLQSIGKPWWKVRGLNVFVDESSLSAAPALWPALASRIADSRYLILLASPQAAASKWVDREVAAFIGPDGGGLEQLLIGLTDGQLAWDEATGDFRWDAETPLCPCLKGKFPTEPLWVDLTSFRADPTTASRANRAFLDAALNLAAAIRGRDKADLYSDELRRQRRNLRIAYGVATVMAGLGIAAGIAAWLAVQNERRATMETRRATHNFSIAQNVVDHVVFDVAQGLRDVEGIRVKNVHTVLDRVQTAVSGLMKAAPNDVRVLRSRSVMLTEFGTTYLATGDTRTALSEIDEAVAIDRRLVGEEPKNAVWRRDLSVALLDLGNIKTKTGDNAAALAAYAESLAIRRSLLAENGNAPRRRDDVALLLRVTGRLKMNTGDAVGALAAFDEALKFDRRNVADKPKDKEYQGSLASTLTTIGDLKWQVADKRGALSAYRESLGIYRRLAAGARGDTSYRDHVARALNNVGRIQLALGQTTAALGSFSEAVDLVRRLADIDPGNMDLQWRLAMVMSSFGQASLMNGDKASAAKTLKVAVAIDRKLVVKDPSNAQWMSSLAMMLLLQQNTIDDVNQRRAMLKEGLSILDKLNAAKDTPAVDKVIAAGMRQILNALK